MEVVTAIGLAATAAQLATLCIKVAEGLHTIHSKQGRAADSLQAIHHECKTLAAAAAGIESWAYTIDAQSESRRRQCASLDEALKCLMPSIEILTQEVKQILNRIQNDGGLPIWARIRYLWKEEDMNMHLTEVRWQANHIHLLLTTIHLSANQASAKLRHLSDAVSEHYSLGDGQSILSATEFAFDDQLVNTVTYRRALLAAKGRSHELLPDETNRQNTMIYMPTSPDAPTQSETQLPTRAQPDNITQQNKTPYMSESLDTATQGKTLLYNFIVNFDQPNLTSNGVYSQDTIQRVANWEDGRTPMLTIEESPSQADDVKMDDMLPLTPLTTQTTTEFDLNINPASEISRQSDKRKSWLRLRLGFWPRRAPRPTNNESPAPEQQGLEMLEAADVELEIVVRQDLKAQDLFRKNKFVDAIRIWEGALRYLEDIGGDGATYECKAIEMTARIGLAHVDQARRVVFEGFTQRQMPLLDAVRNVREIMDRDDRSTTTDEFDLQLVPQILTTNTVGTSVKAGCRGIRKCCALVLEELFDRAFLEAKEYEGQAPDYREHLFDFYNQSLLFVGRTRSRGCSFPSDESCIHLFAGLAGCYLQLREHQRYRALISEVRAHSDGEKANRVELQVVRDAVGKIGPRFGGMESATITPMLTYIIGVVVRLSRSSPSVRDLESERLLIELLFEYTHYQPLITLLGQLEWEKTEYAAKAGLYLGAAYLEEGKPAEAKRALRSTIASARKNTGHLTDFHSHLAFFHDIYNESGDHDIAAGYLQEIPEFFWYLPYSFDDKTTYHRLVDLGYGKERGNREGCKLEL